MLFVNAKVFTGTGEDDFATAFRIDDGVFTWVGDAAEVGRRASTSAARPCCPGSSTCTPTRACWRAWPTR